GALLIQLLFALAVAMIMVRPFKGNRFFSTIVIIPFGISTVVSAWVFSEIFSAIGGYANSFLQIFGVAVNWHSSLTSELGIVMFSDFWKNTPLIALILFGGLSSVSPSLYEAAAVDGAGPLKRFLHITLPAIAPLMGIALLIRGVSEFNIFALPLVLVGYYPSFMNTLIYYNYQSVLNVGYAYSASVILLVIIMIYAAIVLARGRRNQNMTK
ncbi:binding-protein-dependent transport system inner membrane component, partial [mine drainage metagenome]